MQTACCFIYTARLLQLGDGLRSDRKTYESIRNRDAFTAGKLVAAHDACFGRDENILAAEWVEVGRVGKLRKLM